MKKISGLLGLPVCSVVLCSVAELAVPVHTVLKEHITCSNVARKGWLKAGECENGLCR